MVTVVVTVKARDHTMGAAGVGFIDDRTDGIPLLGAIRPLKAGMAEEEAGAGGRWQ